MTASQIRPRRASAGKMSSSVVYIALGSDVMIAIVKFAAAHYTGSSAMLSEGVHSLVDATTGVFLIYGMWLSRHPSTADHQLGFGREVFFWNFIVALTILALGSGVALVDGISQFTSPRPIETPVVSYCVLLVAFVLEAFSLYSAARDAGLARGRRSLSRYLLHSRDATSLTVLSGSASGILGVAITAAGTFCATTYGRPQYDGAASILISVILAVTALFLARGSKDLLIGVPATGAIITSILAMTADHPLVRCANGSLSVHLAPDQILVALSVEFRPEGTTETIQDAITQIDRTVRQAHPEVVIFLVKPQSASHFQTIKKTRGW